MLVKIGFKEIEVGFPGRFRDRVRVLPYSDRAGPDSGRRDHPGTDPAREHIIKKTFEAIKGVKQAVVHLYNSTSVAQREQVFKKSKEDIIQIAVDGAELLQRLDRGRRRQLSF